MTSMEDLRDRRLSQTESLVPGDLAVVARWHLMVIRGETSLSVPLPRTGVLRIGRDPAADITLDDGKASREHARILVADGQVKVTDLDSRNGTRVNGEAITGTLPLALGDVITIGASYLVLHGQARAPERSGLRAFASFRERLVDEIERAIECRRTVAVVALETRDGLSATLRGAVEDAAARELRRIDLVSHDGKRWLYAALPEVQAPAAQARARALVAAIGAADIGRAGVALCPDDASDPATLLAVARSAAEGVTAGGTSAAPQEAVVVGTAADAVQVRALGERQVILADPAMIRLYDLIGRLAASDLTVLISGETGCGKENAAFALHQLSPSRSAGPFVTINCAALQDTLFESELFGYKKGAFSGAHSDKPGLLEMAHGGTVFLDELGELSLAAQAKLLRVLETRALTRVGDVRERPIDIRVVAATNRDLAAEVEARHFRRDLYFRVSAAAVHLPPLRERPREIPVLGRCFLDAACAASGRDPLTIAGTTWIKLLAYDWPGNVRELKSAIEFAVATVTGFQIEPEHLPARIFSDGTGDPRDPAASDSDESDGHPGPAGSPAGSIDPAEPEGPRFRPLGEELEELEQLRMNQALAAAGGVKTQAARLISMPVRTFVHKFKRYGMSEP